MPEQCLHQVQIAFNAFAGNNARRLQQHNQARRRWIKLDTRSAPQKHRILLLHPVAQPGQVVRERHRGQHTVAISENQGHAPAHTEHVGSTEWLEKLLADRRRQFRDAPWYKAIHFRQVRALQAIDIDLQPEVAVPGIERREHVEEWRVLDISIKMIAHARLLAGSVLGRRRAAFPKEIVVGVDHVDPEVFADQYQAQRVGWIAGIGVDIHGHQQSDAFARYILRKSPGDGDCLGPDLNGHLARHFRAIRHVFIKQLREPFAAVPLAPAVHAFDLETLPVRPDYGIGLFKKLAADHVDRRRSVIIGK